MIISHKHKFIFIKTRKTGGTSMEIALSKICGDNDIITSISPRDEEVRKEYSQRTVQNDRIPLGKLGKIEIIHSIYKRKLPRFENHMPCRAIKKLISEKTWNNYYKFTIERNPFDKIVSLYFWRGGDKKFENIYEFLTKGGFSRFEGYDLYSINGIVAVDRVYKYENIDTICNDISEKLKLKEPISLPKYKAKSHTRIISDYKEILDEKSIELIKVIFAREIELFNYSF